MLMHLYYSHYTGGCKDRTVVIDDVNDLIAIQKQEGGHTLILDFDENFPTIEVYNGNREE